MTTKGNIILLIVHTRNEFHINENVICAEPNAKDG